jgi:hypothetical protein
MCLAAFSARGRKRAAVHLPHLLEDLRAIVDGQSQTDCLTQWWEAVRERFHHLTSLGIHLDNGPANHSRRTQFMQRMADFVRHYRLQVRGAYYPPSHSKDNPIERCWGILENPWNGALLDSIATVFAYAQTMTWKGMQPAVSDTAVSDIDRLPQRTAQSPPVPV